MDLTYIINQIEDMNLEDLIRDPQLLIRSLKELNELPGNESIKQEVCKYLVEKLDIKYLDVD